MGRDYTKAMNDCRKVCAKPKRMADEDRRSDGKTVGKQIRGGLA